MTAVDASEEEFSTCKSNGDILSMELFTEKIGNFVSKNNLRLQVSTSFIPGPKKQIADDLSRIPVGGRGMLLNNMVIHNAYIFIFLFVICFTGLW